MARVSGRWYGQLSRSMFYLNLAWLNYLIDMKTRGVQVRSQITKVLFASSFLLFFNAATCLAQDKIDFKVGDSIYVNIYSGGCVKATVKGIDPKYYVHVEEGGYKGSDTFYN